MSEAKVICSGCGKAYTWRAEFAGKKVKCKCGAVFEMPKTAPEPEKPKVQDDDLFELEDTRGVAPLPDPDALLAATAAKAAKPISGPSAPNPVKPPAAAGPDSCPGCGAHLPEAAVICMNCGYNRRTKKQIEITKIESKPGSDKEPAASTAPVAADAPAKPSAVSKIMGMFKREKK
jgi:hypothetical protein